MTAKQFGERLYRLRRGLAFTQAEMAKKIGFSTQYYGNLENGNKNPTLRTLVVISEGLGISLSELFGEGDPRITEMDGTMYKAMSEIERIRPEHRDRFVEVIKIFAEMQ